MKELTINSTQRVNLRMLTKLIEENHLKRNEFDQRKRKKSINHLHIHWLSINTNVK